MLSNKIFSGFRLGEFASVPAGQILAGWVHFKFGETEGSVTKEIYDLFFAELKRLQMIRKTDKLTPCIEAMVINSAMTPMESIK